jgi:hypothetical protein
MITEANMDKTKKAYLKGLYFTFVLFVYIHLTACIWYYIIQQNKTWYPPFDFINYTASQMWTGEYTNFTKWLICIYYCVLVLGGNELGPSNSMELIYIVIINLVGAIVNA